MFIFVVPTPCVANDRLKPTVLESIVVELASSDVQHSVNSPSVENGTLVNNYLNQLPCKRRGGGKYLTSSWNNDINNDNDNNNNNNSNIDKNYHLSTKKVNKLPGLAASLPVFLE